MHSQFYSHGKPGIKPPLISKLAFLFGRSRLVLVLLAVLIRIITDFLGRKLTLENQRGKLEYDQNKFQNDGFMHVTTKTMLPILKLATN